MNCTLCNMCVIENLATGRILVRHRLPKVSTIFLQLHISERTGRGVPKIINAYDRGIFEFGENTISVILPYNRLEVEAQTPPVDTPVDTPVNAQVGDLTPPSQGCYPPSHGCYPPSRYRQRHFQTDEEKALNSAPSVCHSRFLRHSSFSC